MATVHPPRFEGLAWVHPIGFIALPAAEAGRWYVGDVASWYIDAPDDFRWDEADEEGLREFALLRGTNPEDAFWVTSRLYIFNPWPALNQASHENGGGLSGLPEWADERPFKEFEDVKLAEWEENRLLAIKSDPRISYRLGVAVGIAYATVCIHIERVLAFLTRSTRSLAGRT